MRVRVRDCALYIIMGHRSLSDAPYEPPAVICAPVLCFEGITALVQGQHVCQGKSGVLAYPCRPMVCVGLALAHPYAQVAPKMYYGYSWHDSTRCGKWHCGLVKPQNANGRQALCMCTAVYTQTHGMCGACVSTPLCTRAPKGVLWVFMA